jgi:tetratricopeptide (TPR) repeat protein
MLRPFGLTAALALVAAAPAVAKKPSAQMQEQAKEHYTAGMARYNLERYDDAIKEFESAYLIVPDPTFLYNIAQSHRMANRPAKALEYYKRYLRGPPAPPNRTDVEVLMEQMEAKVAEAAKAAKAPPPPAPAPAPPPPVFPKAVPLVEKDTQTGYMSNLVEDNRLYSMIGIGCRKVYGFKVYGMAMYLEDAPARASFPKLASMAQGKDIEHLTNGDLAQTWVLLGDFGKIGVLKFVRNVSAKDVMDAYRDSLNEELKNQSRELKKNIEAFVKLFNLDVKEGDDCTIRTSAAGEISVEMGGKRQKGPTDPTLAQAIWNIWLGKRPISADLRKQLVTKIDVLAK